LLPFPHLLPFLLTVCWSVLGGPLRWERRPPGSIMPLLGGVKLVLYLPLFHAENLARGLGISPFSL
jgi:hypothetical protein